MDAYSWLKALHLIALISWMAGLLYLPRLFVYHAGAAAGLPRIDVEGPERVGADVALGEEVIAGLAEDGPVDRLRRLVAPVSFANPNLIVQHADGRREGASDDRSPWSLALAQA